MADLNINYNVTGLDSLVMAVQSLEANLNKVSNVMGSGAAMGEPIVGPQSQGNNEQTPLSASLDGLKGSQNSLMQRLDALTTQLSQLNQTIKKEGYGKGSSAQSDADKDKKALDEAAALKRKQQNHMRYAAAAVVGMGIYGANSWGSYGASDYGALNIKNPANYADFAISQYNKKQDLINSGVGAGAALIGAGAMAMPVTTAGGMMAKGAAVLAAFGISAATGYETSKNKDINEKSMTQDTIAWRLNNLGISSAQGRGALLQGKDRVPVTGLQALGLTGGYAQYETTLGDVIGSGKRDIINRMNKTQANQFNAGVNQLGLLTGNSNYGQISSIATQWAGANGMSPNQAILSLLDQQAKVGGDTAANTAKMLDLMKSTGMSGGAAQSLVNRYQYNDAMIQNQVAEVTASPSALFQRYVRMTIGGADKKELASGQWNTKHMNRIRQGQASSKMGAYDPMAEIMYGATVPGQNIFASGINATESSGSLGSLQQTDLQKAVGDAISNGAKEMTVKGDQNVYLYGGNVNITSGPATTSRSTASKGLPNPGTGGK